MKIILWYTFQCKSRKLEPERLRKFLLKSPSPEKSSNLTVMPTGYCQKKSPTFKVLCRALFEKTSKHFSNYNFFHGCRLVTLSLFHLTITVFFLTFYTQLSFWLFFFQKFPRTDFFRSQSNREIRGSSCNLFPFLFTNLFWKVLNLSNLPP